MQPDNFEDISAALALYRPGPMGVNAHTNFALRKNGKQEIVPLDPQLKGKLQPEMVEALEPILGTTYGLVIYQEQVMEIAQKLAGYTLGNADLLRRAMGKKKKEVLDAEYVPFSDGMKAQGLQRGLGRGAVGRPRPVLRLRVQQGAHGRLRPRVVLDGLPQGELPGRVHGRAAHQRGRRQGQVGPLPRRVPADGHQGAARRTSTTRSGSSPRSAPTSGSACTRSATSATTSSRRSSRAREEKGAFTSFRDFMSKVPAVVCNKRTIESLIKGGAFDGLAETRMGLLRIHEEYVDAFVAVKRQEAIGQDSLFGAFGDDAAGASGGDLMGLSAVPGRRVGQADPALLRARDARPLRLGPPALRRRARPEPSTPTPRSPR